MSVLLTHIDDDGKCAAAIAYREMFTINERPEDTLFYNYQDEPILPEYEFLEKEKVVITDLSINDRIMDFVKRAFEAGCEVYHVDHHATTIVKSNSFTEEEKAIYDKVHTFFSAKFSATMLMWIWACANAEERADINTIWEKIDFTEVNSHIGFNPEKPNERVYRIPDVVRFIDDWDLWKFEHPETKPFHYGFEMELAKMANSPLWDELLYNFNAPIIVTKRYLDPGRAIEGYLQSEYAMLRRQAFDATIPGFEDLTCIAINGLSNSFAFGELIEQYDVCVLFHFDGTTKDWKYSIYSKDGGVDVSEIAKAFGGGGHEHASGFRTQILIFA